ncbi:alginate lyase family protein [Chitinophaga sp. HK235]|uniref:alginate lyase family protein n=1 Tax=Chitinophaga sp. HK235 TaxID=2952571 RepID=UPI001BAB275F|nr:alginate lyase family protein [Chitinophaga sp. HK235]
MKYLLSICLLLAGLGAVAQQFVHPAGGIDVQTFLLKSATLEANKIKLQLGDSGLLAALKGLQATAEKTLQHGIYSVTFKKKLPPSGNVHDYMSVGPYWWPDSTKPDGLPYVRRDGVVNPERFDIQDAEYYNALCRDVYTLGVTWYFTGESRYAAHAVKLLRAWFLDSATLMNPHLNYGQAIPGITEGRGIGLIDTHNTAMLVDGIQLLKAAPELTTDDYAGIQSWYRRFLEWMRTSPIGLDEARQLNNHGTWYDVQAVVMALFTEQRELAATILNGQTKQRIDRQLTPDGRQPLELARTLSWNYSQMNLEGFVQLALLAENTAIDLWHYESPAQKSLEQAFRWMLPYAAGQKKWTYQQIKPLNPDSFTALTVRAADRYPEAGFATLWQQHPFVPSDLYRLTHRTY